MQGSSGEQSVLAEARDFKTLFLAAKSSAIPACRSPCMCGGAWSVSHLLLRFLVLIQLALTDYVMPSNVCKHAYDPKKHCFLQECEAAATKVNEKLLRWRAIVR